MVDSVADLVKDDDTGLNPETLVNPPSINRNPVVPNWPTGDTAEAKDLADQDKFLQRYGISGTLNQRFKDMLDAQEKQRQEEIRLVEQNRADREASLKAINNLKQPPLPVLKDIPSAPPASAYTYQNPFLAFQNPGVFLALMASFATRTPLTAAFNSAAAALKGFHEGDRDAIKQNVAKWKDDVEAASKQNKVETDKYLELWNRYHDNYERLLAEMQAHAAGFKDDIMMAQLRYAGPKETWELIQHRIQAGTELDKSKAEVDKAHAQAEEAHTKAQLMASSGITPEQIDFDVKQMLQGALLTEVEPNIGRGVQGDAKRTLINAEFARQATAMGLTANDIIERRNTRAASRVAATAEARTVATRSAALDIVAREVEKQIPDTLASAEKVWRSGFVPLNQVLLWSQSHLLSTPGAADFKTANLQLAELWGRAMNPGGVMRESDRAFALDLLSTAASPAAYRAVVARLQKSIGRMREAIREFRAEHLREPKVAESQTDTSELPAGRDVYSRAGETAAGKISAPPETTATPAAGSDNWVTDKDTGIKVNLKPIGGTAPPATPNTPNSPAGNLETPAVPQPSGSSFEQVGPFGG